MKRSKSLLSRFQDCFSIQLDGSTEKTLTLPLKLVYFNIDTNVEMYLYLPKLFLEILREVCENA